VPDVTSAAQLSIFSAEARDARLSDLAGLLCGPGQLARFGASGTARLSLVLDDPARARALEIEAAAREIGTEVVEVESGSLVLRTAFRRDLVELAATWTRGAVKTVPAEWQLDGPTLRLWALTAGAPDGRGGYLLALDPHAPQTHQALVAATTRAGLPPARVGGALRISGTRRVARLVELVGPPPARVPSGVWPRYRGRAARQNEAP